MKGDADTLMLFDPAKESRELRVLTFDKIKNGPPVEAMVLRFDAQRATVEATDGDAVMAMKPRLGEVQRIVKERGEISTARLKAAIIEELELGKTQSEGLIYSAHEAGLIRRVKREVWGPFEEALPF